MTRALHVALLALGMLAMTVPSLPAASAACVPSVIDPYALACAGTYYGCAPYVAVRGGLELLCGPQTGVCVPSVVDPYALACAGTYYGCVPYVAVRGGLQLLCGQF